MIAKEFHIALDGHGAGISMNRAATGVCVGTTSAFIIPPWRIAGIRTGAVCIFLLIVGKCATRNHGSSSVGGLTDSATSNTCGDILGKFTVIDDQCAIIENDSATVAGRVFSERAVVNEW
ncbi:hypothetical protein [Bifidobacterium cebidarum]|uniref:hypothetical protein n=1 Tax=Bifidobacterium cebidarum TaxID=2650773 RepID=UPI001264CA4E|nr:hypothetical protein [Bifidobacterium cebidarum]